MSEIHPYVLLRVHIHNRIAGIKFLLINLFHRGQELFHQSAHEIDRCKQPDNLDHDLIMPQPILGLNAARINTYREQGVERCSSGGQHGLWPVETNHKKFLFGNAAVLIEQFWMGGFESSSVFCFQGTTHQSNGLSNHEGKKCCVGERINKWEHWISSAWSNISEARHPALAAMFSGPSCK